MVSLHHLQSHDPLDAEGEGTPVCRRVNPPVLRSATDASQCPRMNLVDSRGGLSLTVLPVTLHPVSSLSPEPGEVSRSATPSAGEFSAFFSATLAPLRRYLSRLVGSRDEAQDIAQDAYAKVFTVMQDRKVEHPQALLYTTARNLAIDELKHRSRSPFQAGAGVEAVPAGSPGIEAIVMAREESHLLSQAISRLPDECRRVLLLRTGEQLTHEQIALKLGLTRKQVEKRLYRAVHLLHTAMRPPSSSP